MRELFKKGLMATTYEEYNVFDTFLHNCMLNPLQGSTWPVAVVNAIMTPLKYSFKMPLKSV